MNFRAILLFVTHFRALKRTPCYFVRKSRSLSTEDDGGSSVRESSSPADTSLSTKDEEETLDNGPQVLLNRAVVLVTRYSNVGGVFQRRRTTERPFRTPSTEEMADLISRPTISLIDAKVKPPRHRCPLGNYPQYQAFGRARKAVS